MILVIFQDRGFKILVLFYLEGDFLFSWLHISKNSPTLFLGKAFLLFSGELSYFPRFRALFYSFANLTFKKLTKKSSKTSTSRQLLPLPLSLGQEKDQPQPFTLYKNRDNKIKIKNTLTLNTPTLY